MEYARMRRVLEVPHQAWIHLGLQYVFVRRFSAVGQVGLPEKAVNEKGCTSGDRKIIHTLSGPLHPSPIF